MWGGLFRAQLAAVVLAFAGCASVPQATHETGGNSRITLVKPETGKRDILRCCALMENWAPDQRPLLR